MNGSTGDWFDRGSILILNEICWNTMVNTVPKIYMYSHALSNDPKCLQATAKYKYKNNPEYFTGIFKSD